MKQCRTLVLIKQGNLGDHLCAVPAYASLKKRYNKLILITQKGKGLYAGAEELFAQTDLFDSIFSLNTPVYHFRNIPTLLQILFTLWPSEAGLVFSDLMTTTKKHYMQIFWSVLLKKKVKGFDSLSREEYRRLLRSNIKFDNQNNKIWYWKNDKFSHQEKLDPELGREFVNKLANRASASFVGGLPSNYFVISAWSKDSIKTWPLERFLEIARRVSEQYDLIPIFIGSNQDEQYFGSIRKKLSSALGFFGSPMADIAHLIKNARIVITNDSMIGHFAALNITSCVSIFSARTLPYIWWPDNKKGIVIQRRLECEGCELRRMGECPYTHKCIRQIKSSEVLNKIEELLKS